MKKIIYTDIQTLLDNNIDVTKILEKVKIIMNIEYPECMKWFDEKLIPGLILKERNIILAFKNGELISFINLKKTKKEQKMSNLYNKSSYLFNYNNNHFNKMIDLSIEWLEKDDPIIIIPEKYYTKWIMALCQKDWNVSKIIKKDNSKYYILNGYHEFKAIEDLIKQKRKKYINNNKNY